MSKRKVLTVVGARPQFVKAAALSPILRSSESVDEVVVHTGQHFDANMSDVFFDELEIPPLHFNLGIGGGTHGQNTGRMIEAIEAILLSERPDLVVVYGDTDSTLATAIATAKLSVPLAHVEAGLRSHRRSMPEEINRVVADHLSDVLYAPSQTAVSNLGKEGIAAAKVVRVGDVMFDIVRRFTSVARAKSTIMTDRQLREREYILMTVHRKENVDERESLEQILSGVASAHFPVLFPVHPRTAARIESFGLKLPPVVSPIPPLGYLDTLALEAAARMILTDSGGMQKEAYFHGVPCLTLRDETEWVELVEVGANVLVGANSAKIREGLATAKQFTFPHNLYGDGFAADRIVADLLERTLR